MCKLWPGQIRTDACTHNTRTHIHRTEVVTTISRSPQAGTTKMIIVNIDVHRDKALGYAVFVFYLVTRVRGRGKRG